MNINLLQNKLKEGLNIIGRGTSKSSSLPILKNILFSVKENFLNLSATDLEIGIKWWTLVKTNKEGKTTIPYNSFASFINFLPDKKIDIEEKNNNLLITCDDYKTQINGISADEFPIIPEVKEKEKVIINSTTLSDKLLQIIDVPSLSKVKPEISGILFLFDKKELMLVATDSYRLAEGKIFLKKENKDSFSFIIPQRTVREVVNIFKDLDKDIEIIFGENQILFKTKMDDFNHSYIELTSKVIEGNYPNYESIIPKECKTQIILNKDEFLNKIKAASVFTSKVNEVNLKISPKEGEIIIESNNVDLGNYETKIKGRAEGNSVEISFNYRFILDGLVNIKSSEVIFEINDENSPGVLKPVGKSDFVYIVMPIKK
jgi:DNA polymerase III subunit beta